MDKKLLTEALKTKNTVTFFYADWCGGCKVANPMVQEIANALGFEIISINENEELETIQDLAIIIVRCQGIYFGG